MTAATLCLAAALLVAPDAPAPARLRRSAPRLSGRLLPRGIAPAGMIVGALTLVMWVDVAAAIAATAVVATTSWRVRTRRRAERSEECRRVLLSGLDTVIADLKVGRHSADACDSAAQETAGPAATAFTVAAARARLGGSAADGLRSPAAIFDDDGIGESLERIADAWEVSDRHGLALAELLLAARTDLAARMRIRARTEAGLAGARATASVLAALPLLGVGLGQMMGADPLGILLAGGLGGAMLVAGAVLVCAGLLWTDRIAARVGA